MAVHLAIAALVPALVLATSPATASPGVRFLAIDPAAVDPAINPGLRVQLGPVAKDTKSPFFGEDKPWDIAWWNTYPTVAYDSSDSKYKIWYNGVGNCSCAKGAKGCSVVAPFGA